MDFHGEKRSNETHASTTDPEARRYKKSAGSEAKWSYLGPALAENRHGWVVQARVSPATGTAEREAGLEMMAAQTDGQRRVTLGGNKGYDVRGFVDDLRELQVTPHVAQNQKRRGSDCARSLRGRVA